MGGNRALRAAALLSATTGIFAASPAFAQCSTTTAGNGTVTIACGNTSTAPALNSNGNNPSTVANIQVFNAAINMTINSGTTLNGWGLYLGPDSQTPSGTPQPISVVNNGTISHTAGWTGDDEGDGLNIATNSGSITYSGNGSVITNAASGANGLANATALVLFTSGQANSITVGSQAAPVTGTFSGEDAIRLAAQDGGVDAWFAGGTITGTQASNGGTALSLSASRSINLTMTGQTVVNGQIGVGITTGAGYSPASVVTIATNAQVTNAYSAGAGLSVFSREGGANVTLTSGASIDVANIGVLLVAISGESRFTTAAGTAINQTGNSGALRTGLWFTPSGTGSLVADLSGTIAATGTGLLLSPTNGNATVTIRAGGSVSGDQTGIQVFQSAGATGAVNIQNSGTISGAVAVGGTPAGTAFTLTNSGTITGRVNVTGSSVATSLLANSGTWNLGAGNSTFSGSVTNSGTLNMADGAVNTLTIGGNLVLNAGSIFRVDIGNGTNDRVNVTGTASLNGSLLAFATGSVFTPGTYTILNATGGVSGTFSSLGTTPNTPAQLHYDANNVTLEVTNNQVFTTSTREALVFNAPTVTTNRVNVFSTQIIGRLVGGTPLYDQTFAAAFSSPTVQNAVIAARAAITTAGGPGVIIGDPVRLSSATTSSTSSVTTLSLAGPGVATQTVETHFGPATYQIGALSSCNVSSLPSPTRPTCTSGGTSFNLGDGLEGFNMITTTTYTINEARTDTITDTLRETWELTGQVAAVGTIHAEVQSGLFDLGSRLLNRLTGPLQANAGWGEVYAFRVSQAGHRGARGFAAGANVGLAPGLTLAFGIDHGNLDIDVPGAKEEGDVNLTEGGAALRLERGPFTAALSATWGQGNARTLRTIIGSSGADYDVRVAGVAFDLGYAVQAGGWTLRPLAGLDYVSVRSDGFTETDTLGLVVARQKNGRVRASAGLEAARRWGNVQLAASARYLTILDGDERVIPVAFALAPGRILEMTAPNEPDTFLLSARLLVPLGPRAGFTLGYDGRFGSGYEAHMASAGLQFSF